MSKRHALQALIRVRLCVYVNLSGGYAVLVVQLTAFTKRKDRRRVSKGEKIIKVILLTCRQIKQQVSHLFWGMKLLHRRSRKQQSCHPVNGREKCRSLLLPTRENKTKKKGKEMQRIKLSTPSFDSRSAEERQRHWSEEDASLLRKEGALSSSLALHLFILGPALTARPPGQDKELIESYLGL